MKMRTLYLKVSDMAQAKKFWQDFFATAPRKDSSYWTEFRCENINFGLLWDESFSPEMLSSNFVPVFEYRDDELEMIKARALEAGAKVLIDIRDHPDRKSYVLLDPMGNEFEITRFHDV